jgi:hypothetical protein
MILRTVKPVRKNYTGFIFRLTAQAVAEQIARPAPAHPSIK